MQMKTNILSSLTHIALRYRAEKEISGLPALMAAAERAVSTLSPGDHKQRKSGTGEGFWQFREYDSADRPQDIDWRQSAKSDHVYVRQKELQNAQSILFWVQNDRGMHLKTGNSQQTKHEAGIILSLALGILLTRAGEKIAPLSEPSRAGRNETALQYLGTTLCAMPDPLPPGPQTPPHSKPPKNSSIILAGDFMHKLPVTEEILKDISAQAPYGIILQILDPAEINLPFNGRVIFRPFDDSHAVPIANVQSIRESYSEKISRHIHDVKLLAQQYGYGHILHITGTDIHTTLSKAYEEISSQTKYDTGH